MILRPPIFTLFPYTTLFRSLLPIVGHYLLLLLGLGPLAVVFRHLNFNRRVAGLYRERVGVHGLSSHAASAVTADRKSTRLNSSHMSISYAVFCLKKKKQTKYIPFLSADRLCPFCYTPRPGPPFLPDLLSDPLSAFFGLAPLPLAHLCRLAFPPAP